MKKAVFLASLAIMMGSVFGQGDPLINKSDKPLHNTHQIQQKIEKKGLLIRKKLKKTLSDACEKNDINVIDHLLQKHMSVCDVISYAYENHYDEMVEYLLDKNRGTWLSIFSYANIYKYSGVMKYIIDNTDLDKDALLVIACEYDNKDIVEYLIEKGANVNTRDKKGRTLLYIAIKNIFDRKDESIIENLIKARENHIKLVNKREIKIAREAINQGDVSRVTELIKKSSSIVEGLDIEKLQRYMATYLRMFYLARGKTVSMAASYNGGKISEQRFNIFLSIDEELKNHLLLSNQRLISAIENIRKDLVEYLIDQGANINGENEDGETPLFAAVKSRDEKMVKFLIANGANNNSESKDGKTLLFTAVEGKAYTIADYFISEHGADVNKALRIACQNYNKKAIEYLIKHNADINEKGENDETPLYIACKAHLKKSNKIGDIALEDKNNTIIKFLIKKGANIDEAIQVAVKKNEKDVVQYLVQCRAGLNKEDEIERTPLSRTRSLDHKNSVEYLTKKGVDIGEETQIVGKSNEKDDVALPQKDKASKKIAVSGADKNKKEVQREKSIEERVKSLLKKNQNNAIRALFIAIETNDKKVASYLIKHGVNVDEVLYIAIKNSRKDIVKYIIKHGAKINKVNNIGITPLLYAAKSNNFELVKYLVEHGAKINKVSNIGITPLLYAAKSNNFELVKYLVEHGAKINQTDNWGRTSLSLIAQEDDFEFVKYLVEHGAKINQVDNSGKTPLLYAARKNNFELVKYLVEHEAEINQADNLGKTSLLYAARHNNFELVRYLVKCGAEINQADNSGRTPLSYATEKGDLKVVKYLVKCGAEINQADNSGRTPLSYATEKGDLKVVKYLVKHENKTNIEDNS